MATLSETHRVESMADAQLLMVTYFADGWNLQSIVPTLVPVQGPDNEGVMVMNWDITFTKEVPG